jgi:hypothetical protein
MKTKVIIAMVFVALLSALVMPTFAARPSTPPGQVITGGSFYASDAAVSYSAVYTDPVAYYPQSWSKMGAYNTYGPQFREFFTSEYSGIITLRGTVYLENIGQWPDTTYLEVGIGFLNSWYFTATGYPNWKGPSCYIIFFGGDAGYDVHIQTQPTERPSQVLTFSAYFDPDAEVYESASFIYEMTINFEDEAIYLRVKHSETGSIGTVTYGFSEFGWDKLYLGYSLDPADLAGDPVFAGIISVNNAGHASISAIRVTESP